MLKFYLIEKHLNQTLLIPMNIKIRRLFIHQFHHYYFYHYPNIFKLILLQIDHQQQQQLLRQQQNENSTQNNQTRKFVQEFENSCKIVGHHQMAQQSSKNFNEFFIPNLDILFGLNLDLQNSNYNNSNSNGNITANLSKQLTNYYYNHYQNCYHRMKCLKIQSNIYNYFECSDPCHFHSMIKNIDDIVSFFLLLTKFFYLQIFLFTNFHL